MREATAVEYMIGLSVLLIVGAVASVVGVGKGRGKRWGRGKGRGTRGSTGTTGTTGLSGLAAEAEANHWVVRLGESMIVPDARLWAGADEGTGRALSSAMEHHRTARLRLAEARTAEEYDAVARIAREGLRQVRVAREGLGLDRDGGSGRGAREKSDRAATFLRSATTEGS